MEFKRPFALLPIVSLLGLAFAVSSNKEVKKADATSAPILSILDGDEYEMNYNSSLVKINENKTVELLATIMPKSLEVEKCVKHISQYIKHRLANN